MPKINITGNASAGNKAADIERAYSARDAAQRAQSTKAQLIADAIDKRSRIDPIKKRAQEDALWRDRERRVNDAANNERKSIKEMTALEIKGFENLQDKKKKERTAETVAQKKLHAQALKNEREEATLKRVREREAYRKAGEQRRADASSRFQAKAAASAQERIDKDTRYQARAAATAQERIDREKASGRYTGGRPQPQWHQNLSKASDVLGDATAGALETMLGAASKILAAATALGVEGPLLPGQVMRGALSLAEPFTNLKVSSYAMGRAGGFSGEGLLRGLDPGTGTQNGTEWMSTLGLTPEKVMASLGRYGIVPKSGTGAIDLAKEFGFSNLLPSFSGMDEFTAEKIARQGVGMGSAPNTAQGVQTYLSPFRDMLTDATARGMDRAKVLDNIQGSLESIEKSGALGVSSSAVIDMFNKFAAAGSAGGRTGAATASTIEGLQGFISNPLANSPGTFALVTQAHKYGDLKTKADVRNFAGADNWAAAGQSPGIRDRATKDILAAAKAGDMLAATTIATTMLMGGDGGKRVAELQEAASRIMVPDKIGYRRATALGNLTNTGMRGGYQLEELINGKGAGAPDSRAQLNDSDDSYRQMLKAAGVPDNLIEDFIRSGRRRGVNPMLLASIAKTENAKFDPLAFNSKGSGAYGIMQVMPSNWSTYGGGPNSRPGQEIDAGSAIFSEMLNKTGGDVNKALALYAGARDPSKAEDYVNRVGTAFNTASLKANLPSDVFAAKNQESQATLNGAEYAMNKLVPLAQIVSDKLEGLGNSAERAAVALGRLANPGQHGAAGHWMPHGATGTYTAPNQPMSPMHQ